MKLLKNQNFLMVFFCCIFLLNACSLTYKTFKGSNYQKNSNLEINNVDSYENSDTQKSSQNLTKFEDHITEESSSLADNITSDNNLLVKGDNLIEEQPQVITENQVIEKIDKNIDDISITEKDMNKSFFDQQSDDFDQTHIEKIDKETSYVEAIDQQKENNQKELELIPEVVPNSNKVNLQPKIFKQIVVKCNVLNIRKRSDIGSTVIGKLKKNDIISVVSSKGRWYNIRTNEGLTGWISAKYAIEPTTAKYWKNLNFVVVNTKKLNVRKYYGSDEPVVFSLYKGNKIQVVSKAVEKIQHKGKLLRRGWLKIKTEDGKEGWVAGWFTSPVLDNQAL